MGCFVRSQSKMMRQYHLNGYKTLVSNNYDLIIETILDYFKDVRMQCSYCPRKFISYESIRRHIKGFHKRV